MTPASPYFVQHPASATAGTPTVVFIPGGSGSRDIAQRVWARFLSDGDRAGEFRIVVPYSEEIDLIDDAQRVFGVVDEALACYGGDPGRVHIAGTSNGGLAAFALILAAPERFASLLGAPGGFPEVDSQRVSVALAGKRVFNGVGSDDIGWMPGVKATHERLLALGLDSIYVEFQGQAHQVNLAFDESVFFEFWRRVE